MKKLVLTTLALVAGAAFVHAQGLVSINAGTVGTMETNGAALGEGTGGASGSTSYYVELLDMTSAAWNGLSAQQQAGAANLYQNPTDISLWTDSEISGAAGQGLSAGKINGLGGAGGTTASNWGAPTGASYSTGPTDYYLVVGWSSNEGTTWGAVEGNLTNSTLVTGGWFGATAVYYNEAGGGSAGLSVVNLWNTSVATTGLAGAGTPSGDVAGILTLNPVSPVPEPTTLALAGLGGLSMLFLRRRK